MSPTIMKGVIGGFPSAVGAALRGVGRTIRIRWRAVALVAAGVVALDVLLPPLVLSVARAPWRGGERLADRRGARGRRGRRLRQRARVVDGAVQRRRLWRARAAGGRAGLRGTLEHDARGAVAALAHLGDRGDRGAGAGDRVARLAGGQSRSAPGVPGRSEHWGVGGAISGPPRLNLAERANDLAAEGRQIVRVPRGDEIAVHHDLRVLDRKSVV